MKGILTLLTVFAFAQTLSAQSAVVPNGILQIAYRQKEGKTLGKSIHEVELSCRYAQCSLTTLTMNQCVEWMGDEFFWPKVQRTSTSEGNLRVVSTRPGVVVLQETDLEGAIDYIFEFTTSRDDKRQERLQLKSDVFFDRLTGFSGAAVKDSRILDRVITWELVPIRGRSPMVKLDCSPAVHGLP